MIHNFRASPDTAALVSATTDELKQLAMTRRDAWFGNRITYSPKVFLPLTELCRNVCHYCTYAKSPRRISAPYMALDKVLKVAFEGKKQGCREALFTLGEKPELRFREAAKWLEHNGFKSTIEYVAAAAEAVVKQTGLLPHVNAGTLTSAEIERLRPVSASMGIMLETAADRLGDRNMPHYGSPDKIPTARLETIDKLGVAKVPTTTGILIGIGETEAERLEALSKILELNSKHGHIQEVIIQNFRAKPNTRMGNALEPSSDLLLRTVAQARVMFGESVSIQVPPNLNPELLGQLVNAGINDWGGISPVTADFVNPEAAWPDIDYLAQTMENLGRRLVPRLTIYPRYIEARGWTDVRMAGPIKVHSDSESLARDCDWETGAPLSPTAARIAHFNAAPQKSDLAEIVDQAETGEPLVIDQIATLFKARGTDVAYICARADDLRQQSVGKDVTYVVNRNINYTNICNYRCAFCAFSKGKTSDALRGKPYDITLEEISRRTKEAFDRGASEVCMQGGIHPHYTGETYLEILTTAKAAVPGIHVHAFSPLEVKHGAATLGLPIAEYLNLLKESGLGSLPGTAAEILDDEIRAVLCADKVNTAEWLNIMRQAHGVGLRTTATIMFGHIEQPIHWARHLAQIRSLQDCTGGFTEFVPLPFVAHEAPIFLKGQARKGPTLREAVMMHAVARIALHTSIPNIQASWVKMGPEGVVLALQAGANDLGGVLMNESITRAAGAVHGEEANPATIETWIRNAGRIPKQRTTLYGNVEANLQAKSECAPPLLPVQNMLARRRPVVA